MAHLSLILLKVRRKHTRWPWEVKMSFPAVHVKTRRNFLPCKHFFAVFKFSNQSWRNLSPLYIESPYLNLDFGAINTTTREHDIVVSSDIAKTGDENQEKDATGLLWLFWKLCKTKLTFAQTMMLLVNVSPFLRVRMTYCQQMLKSRRGCHLGRRTS